MPTSTDSTRTVREDGRTLFVSVVLLVVFVAVMLPPDGRFGLLIGVALGAVLVFAFWMADGAGRRDTNGENKAP